MVGHSISDIIRHYCDVGEVTLYEDVDYERVVMVRDEQRMERKRVMMSDRQIKKAQSTKAKKEPKAKALKPPRVESPLTTAQKDKLGKEKERLDLIAEALKKFVLASEDADITGMVPVYCVKSAQNALIKVQDSLAFLDMLIETGVGSYAQATQEVKEAKHQGSLARDSLSAMLSQAKDHLAAMGALGA